MLVLLQARVLERFQLSVEGNFAINLVLHYYAFVIGWKISRHFLDQSEVKPKLIVTASRASSRA